MWHVHDDCYWNRFRGNAFILVQNQGRGCVQRQTWNARIVCFGAKVRFIKETVFIFFGLIKSDREGRKYVCVLRTCWWIHTKEVIISLRGVSCIAWWWLSNCLLTEDCTLLFWSEIGNCFLIRSKIKIVFTKIWLNSSWNENLIMAVQVAFQTNTGPDWPTSINISLKLDQRSVNGQHKNGVGNPHRSILSPGHRVFVSMPQEMLYWKVRVKVNHHDINDTIDKNTVQLIKHSDVGESLFLGRARDGLMESCTCGRAGPPPPSELPPQADPPSSDGDGARPFYRVGMYMFQTMMKQTKNDHTLIRLFPNDKYHCLFWEETFVPFRSHPYTDKRKTEWVHFGTFWMIFKLPLRQWQEFLTHPPQKFWCVDTNSGRIPKQNFFCWNPKQRETIREVQTAEISCQIFSTANTHSFWLIHSNFILRGASIHDFHRKINSVQALLAPCIHLDETRGCLFS